LRPETVTNDPLRPARLLLSQPHARLIAIREFDAGSLKSGARNRSRI